MKKLIFLLISSVTFSGTYAQVVKNVLYYNLEEGKYEKFAKTEYVQIHTKLLVSTISFYIPCAYCGKGYEEIGFYWHNSVETGTVFDQIRQLGSKEFLDLKFSTFAEILKKLKTDPTDQKIYFVETQGKKHFLYNVKLVVSLQEE